MNKEKTNNAITVKQRDFTKWLALRCIPADDTKKFLTLIEAPPNLIGIVAVCSNIMSAFDRYHGNYTESMKATHKLASIVMNNAKEIKKDFGPDAIQAKPRGLKESYPLYALLLHDARNFIVRSHFDLLIFPMINQYQKRKANGICHGTLYSACMSFWSVFDNFEQQTIMESLKPKWTSTDDIAEYFYTCADRSSYSGTKRHFLSLARHFNNDGDPSKSSSKKRQGRSRKGKQRVRGLPISDVIPQTNEILDGDNKLGQNQDVHTIQLYQRLSPFEPLGPEIIAFVQKSPYSDITVERNTVYHQAAIAHRHVTGKWPEFTAYERYLITASIWSEKHNDLSAFLWMTLRYYYGWDDNRIKSIESGSHISTNENRRDIIYLEDNCDFFLVPDVQPLRVKNQSPKYFPLPIPVSVSQALREHGFKGRNYNISRKLFAPKQASRIEKWGSSLPFSDRNFSVQKMQNSFVCLAQHHGLDCTIISNIVGRTIPDSRTQTHYTGIKPEQLAKEFVDVHNRFNPELEFSNNALPKIQGLVGDSKALTMAEAKKLLQQAKNNISSISRYAPLWETRFNAIVTYIVLCAQFSSGIRSVVNPLPDTTKMDKELGLLPICDKAIRKDASLRYIYVPNTIRKMLIKFIECREHSLMLCAMNSSTGYKDWLRAIASKSTYDPDILHEQVALPNLFCIQNGIRDAMSPTRLAGTLQVFHKDTDIGRHFLRSELVRRNCPAELIDAQLGHWSIGREPFGPSSSLSITDFALSIAPYLESICSELGIELWKN